MADLETSEAAATGKANVANIWRAVRRDHFVNNEGSISQVSPSGQLHLPKLLKSFHHVYCGGRKCERPRQTEL